MLIIQGWLDGIKQSWMNCIFLGCNSVFVCAGLISFRKIPPPDPAPPPAFYRKICRVCKNELKSICGQGASSKEQGARRKLSAVSKIHSQIGIKLWLDSGLSCPWVLVGHAFCSISMLLWSVRVASGEWKWVENGQRGGCSPADPFHMHRVKYAEHSERRSGEPPALGQLLLFVGQIVVN